MMKVQSAGGQSPPTQFVGIQWRLTVSYLLVGLAGAAMVAGAMAAVTLWGDGAAPVTGPLGRQLLLTALAAAAAAAMLAVITGFVVARRLKHRLRAAGRFAAALSAGNLQQRLQPDAIDEIGQLEVQLNDMADRLSAAMAAVKELAERNRALAYESGALAERNRLARDLHDTVNQELFSLSLLAAALRRRGLPGTAAGDDPAAAAAAAIAAELTEIETMARHAHTTVRELILQLRPPNLAQQGLVAALREYVEGFAARQGIAGSFRAEGPPLPAPTEEALFRMAQEALHNVAKHAAARAVSVALEQTPAGVRLVVRDDGCGFDPNAPARPAAVGLSGLRERAAALGGRVVVRSTPGQGTEVAVQLPAEQSNGEGTGDGAAHPGTDRR